MWGSGLGSRRLQVRVVIMVDLSKMVLVWFIQDHTIKSERESGESEAEKVGQQSDPPEVGKPS